MNLLSKSYCFLFLFSISFFPSWQVRKWLARKRFYAAGYAVVSINRFGRLIEGVRALRRIRRVARFYMRMVRTWIPLVGIVRKKLYSEEVMRQRREEDEKRKKAEEEERKRREAEEERKRKEEEERKRKEEEERKRKIEEQRRKEEEAKKAMEEKISQLTDSTVSLTSRLDSLNTLHTETVATLQQEKALRQEKESTVAELTRQLTSKSEELAALDRRLEEERASNAKRFADFTAAAQVPFLSRMDKMRKR